MKTTITTTTHITNITNISSRENISTILDTSHGETGAKITHRTKHEQMGQVEQTNQVEWTSQV